MAASISCVACRELPEEGILSRYLFFSPAVDLADAIDLFRAGPDDNDGIIDADDGDSASGFSRSRVSTATAVQHERPRRMADLFGEIMKDKHFRAWIRFVQAKRSNFAASSLTRHTVLCEKLFTPDSYNHGDLMELRLGLSQMELCHLCMQVYQYQQHLRAENGSFAHFWESAASKDGSKLPL
ncbi:unnamed protein product [Boreogadus saida]